jgi:hypothetical protein
MNERTTAGLALAAGIAAVAAQAQDKRASSDPLKNADADKRMDEFKKSPDPWKEVAKMEFGGDRTFASGLQTLIFDADPSQYPALEKKVLAILADAGCTAAARDFACRMLSVIGSAAAVPALAPLLENAKTSDVARYALENIPGAEVDAALQAALSKLSGPARDGLAGTIAARAAFKTLGGGAA